MRSRFYYEVFMKISISIVDYNKGARLVESLFYLSKQSLSHCVKVTIIDNSFCVENTKNYLNYIKNLNMDVSVCRTNKNIGYTVATNASVDLTSDYVVILNPDILLKDENTLQYCIDYLSKHNDVGLVGISQQDDEGNIELVSRKYPDLLTQIARRCGGFLSLFFKKRIEMYENAHDYSSVKPIEVDWLQSSFWVMKTDVWIKLNGLQTDYFLFMAEPDFSLRLKSKGLKVVLLPDILAVSDGIRCSAGGFLSFFTSKTIRIHTIDAIRYYFKNLSKSYK